MKDEDKAEQPDKECAFEDTDACDHCDLACLNHPLEDETS
jgi:hypothetical protein